jgi:hypothetical protein
MEDNNKIEEIREDNEKDTKGVSEGIEDKSKKCICLIF